MTNFEGIKRQLRLAENTEQQDPICKFMLVLFPIVHEFAAINADRRDRFVEATFGEKLGITREMLTLILSYHQALPCFLEFLFPFARDLYASDFHFGGLRYQTRFSAEDRGLQIPDRGWSGLDVKVCYNLKSVEHNEDLGSKEWPWYIGQSAVHHSFDIETNQASWMVVMGIHSLKHRIKSATKDQALSSLSFHNQEQAFASTLAVHLIICEWSGQTWRWYINFLDKKIQSSTKPAVSSVLEEPVSLSNVSRLANMRQRRGRQPSQGNQQAAGATTAIPAPEIGQVRETGFSFSNLQGTHAIEERVNNAVLLMKVNQNVLTELRKAYRSFESSPGWPANLKATGHGDLIRFDQRIASIQNDMAIQQSRTEKLLTLIADRKSLVGRRALGG